MTTPNILFIKDCIMFAERSLQDVAKELKGPHGGWNRKQQLMAVWLDDFKMRKERLLKMLEGK